MARILVVDDHEDSRELAAFMLASAGHDTVLAANADEALAMLARERIDLALIDIFMPGKDGIELIREIRRDFAHVKIVAVSAGWHPPTGDRSRWNFEVLARARTLGAEGALPKPLLKEALVTLVEGLLEPAA